MRCERLDAILGFCPVSPGHLVFTQQDRMLPCECDVGGGRGSRLLEFECCVLSLAGWMALGKLPASSVSHASHL